MLAEFHLLKDGGGCSDDIFLCKRGANGQGDVNFQFKVRYEPAHEGVRASIDSTLLSMQTQSMSEYNSLQYGKLQESCMYDEFRIYLMQKTNRLRLRQGGRLECRLNSSYN